MYRIGLDVGGTFTDFTLLNESDGEARFYKVSSTPADPSDAILIGIWEMLETFGVNAGQVSFIGHGTTVATNLVIERRGARTALITDGHKHAPTGVAGGCDGLPALLYLDYGLPGERALPSKVTHLILNHGENIRIETGGAGGLGDPAERPAEALRADLDNGFIAPEDLALYGRVKSDAEPEAR